MNKITQATSRQVIPGLANYSPYEPYPFQISAIAKAMRQLTIKRIQALPLSASYGLLFAPGAGKTATAINIYRGWCQIARRPLKCLVLAPAAVFPHWVEEFKRNAPERLHSSIGVIHGTPAKKRKILKEPWLIYLASIDTPRTDIWNDILAKKFDCIIIDEFHNYKTPPKTNRKGEVVSGKRTAGMLEALSIPFRIAMTGTPITNTEQDLWTLMRYLAPEEVDGNYYAWLRRNFVDVMQSVKQRNPDIKWSKWRIKPEKRQELYNFLDLYSMRVPHAVALPHLPPLVKKQYLIDLAPGQKRVYKDLERDWRAQMGDKTIQVRSIIETIGKLNQIACGAVVTSGGKIKEVNTEKIKVLTNLLEQITPDNKCIVWCPYTAPLVRILKLCESLDIPAVRIDGDVSIKDKHAAIEAFQNDKKVRVCVANQAAGGTGIELQAANYMIYWGRTYNWTHDEQSEKRAYRGGSEQHESVVRIDLVTRDTIEEDVMHVLNNKAVMADYIMERRANEHDVRGN